MAILYQIRDKSFTVVTWSIELAFDGEESSC